MRLFLFLTGGTGSRVMRPFIMQLAAGVHPLDEQGQPIALEVIPIIVDPHKANEDLKRTENLLRWYRSIHKGLYGDRADVRKGFFSAKISTLSDILPGGSNLSDTFLFNLGAVEEEKFSEFIDFNTLDPANRFQHLGPGQSGSVQHDVFQRPAADQDGYRLRRIA